MAKRPIRPTSGEPLSPEQQAELMAQCNLKIAHVAWNYQEVIKYERACLSFNNSLTRVERVTDPRSLRRDREVRVHPLIELTVDDRARRTVPQGPLNNEAITQAARNVVASVRPIQGRPANTTLAFHVQALMVLWRAVTGVAVTASKTKNSVYEPTLTSLGAQKIGEVLQKVDPTITSTAIANIIIRANATGAIKNKSFGDFFPFYGGSIDWQTGMPVPGPGYRLVSFTAATPTYCS